MTSIPQNWKRLKLRKSGVCSVCDIPLPAGIFALWNASQRIIACALHFEGKAPIAENLTSDSKSFTPIDEEIHLSQGIAGSSAMAKNQDLIKKRKDRINKKFPRAGKYILALTNEPQSTKAWEIGAEGEVAVGKILDSLAIKYGFRVLHDRLIPKSRANMDHIAITRAGIFVIDAKNYKGVIQIRDKSGFFEKSVPELWVGKRNRMNLVVGMKKQILIVDAILSNHSIEMPVIGVLTFYAAEWGTFSLLRKQEEVDGVLINSKGIEAILSRDGSLSQTELDATASLLASKLLSAT